MAVEFDSSKVTFAGLAGYEAPASEEPNEALFRDPIDDCYIPQLECVHMKRFPSLATLRKSASKDGVGAHGTVHAQNRFRGKTLAACTDQKGESQRAANALAHEQELPLVPNQGAHLAGAAVLGLRKLTRGADDSLESSQETPFTHKKKMMQAILSDNAEAVMVSKTVKAPKVPRPPSAAPRPRAIGQGKQPIPNNQQVLPVPVTC